MYILLDKMMLFCWYVLGASTAPKGRTVTDDSEPGKSNTCSKTITLVRPLKPYPSQREERSGQLISCH